MDMTGWPKLVASSVDGAVGIYQTIQFAKEILLPAASCTKGLWISNKQECLKKMLSKTYSLTDILLGMVDVPESW